MTTTYEVSVRNTFDAETPEEAVREMIEWITGNAYDTRSRVSHYDTAEFIGWYDGEDCC